MTDTEGRPEVRAVFGAFDTDDDWMLDVHEFSDAMARLTGRHLGDEALLHLFRTADVDGDGLVTLPEFEDCLKEL
ncbi:EF-hand domain-containing protein [Streptomyces sp. NPDC048349]|uniref:EF-hand domain-containing protein n=1 Tax=Streptomyces sp. NPDC048349 TaxID=3155486 RepID=UPI003437F4D8